jgi:hypothetical protein
MNNKNNESINKKILENKLKEIGTNINEVKKWLDSESCNNETSMDDSQTTFSFFKGETCDKKSCEAAKPQNKKTSNFNEFLEYLGRAQDLDGFIDDADEEFDDSDHRVTFVPGTDASDTAVYVGGYKVGGVVRASLEYDAEAPATLILEILDPRIVSNNCSCFKEDF